MKFDDYKFRCSALGKIMSAKGEITQGNATYLRQLFTEEITGKRKDITSKYFEKGHYMEEDGVTMVNEVLHPNDLLIKNKTEFENEFIRGTFDTEWKMQIVYDIKNAWDQFTFVNATLTDDYDWQLRGYMWLTGITRARLFYCLNNMPEHMLIGEERKAFYQGNFVTFEDENYQKLCEEIRAYHNYDRLRIVERFKIWDLEHSDSKIHQLKEKIAKCRAFLNQLWEEREAQINRNITLMKVGQLEEKQIEQVSSLLKKV